jgi:hypothetical protein
MLGYLIAHEGHHRGSILLTLKQTGHKVSTEIQFGIWDCEALTRQNISMAKSSARCALRRRWSRCGH